MGHPIYGYYSLIITIPVSIVNKSYPLGSSAQIESYYFKYTFYDPAAGKFFYKGFYGFGLPCIQEVTSFCFPA